MKTFILQSFPALAFTVLLVTMDLSTVHAQPITAAADGTGTLVNQTGDTFTITGGTQSGENLYQSFQQFGLNQGQTANFLSRPDIANILGRVTGGDPSVIQGLIQVTGGESNLFLLNPAGFLFGADSRLNLPAAFTATTANAIGVGNGWFNAVGHNDYKTLAGVPNSFAFLSSPGGIINAGKLSGGQGQKLTLLGGMVLNTGKLAVPGGELTIAAVAGGKLVRISQTGSLLSLELQLADQTGIHPAVVTPLSLPQLLTGNASSEATGVTVDNGVVKLTAANTSVPIDVGTNIVSGTLTTASTTPATMPATINVLGDRIELVNAHLDASGITGGGTILIGGDYQGNGTVPNAQATTISSNSVLKADALHSGNGGKVIVWADQNTQFGGKISARGGEQGGDGGFVETSGKQTLWVNGGQVDASAPQGRSGTWFLDPTDLNIANTGGTITPNAIANTLDSSTNLALTTASDAADSGDITLSDPINQTGGGTAALSLTGRRFLRSGSATINMNSTGGLTFNLNQVNPEANAPSSSVQAAIDAIAMVAGNSTINLGVGTYSGSTLFVTKALTLNGVGASNTILSGNNAYQVLSINTPADTTVNLNNLTITEGKPTDNNSGGISNTGGNLNINNSIVSSNLGDGITNRGQFLLSGAEVTISNSTISNNLGSGIDNQSLFYSGKVTVNHSTISNNSANYGSGIHNYGGKVTISNSTISNNLGHGIYNVGSAIPFNSDGEVTINHSTISGNSKGGIYNSGILDVRNSTISGNSAIYGGGILNSSAFCDSHIYCQASLTVISNSTISGNSAIYGGGIYNGGPNSYLAKAGTTLVSDSTISDNSATYGGGIFNEDGRVTVNHSLVAGNTALTGREIDGSFTSDGYNLFGYSGSSGLTAHPNSTDLVPSVPLSKILAPLGNYGGPTQTMALLPNSPAIDAGDPTVTTADQRGVLLVGIQDIGAYEATGFALTLSGDNHQSTAVNTAFAYPLSVTVTETAFNHPIPGVSVNLTGPTRGASTTPSSASLITNMNGQTSLNATANTVVGSYTVTANVEGVLETANFRLTNLANAPTSIHFLQGSGQATLVNSDFAQPLKMLLLDQYHNPISNVAIAFAVPPSGASAILSPFSTTTDANGQINVVATANNQAGPYTIAVLANGVRLGSFALTNLANQVEKDFQVRSVHQPALTAPPENPILCAERNPTATAPEEYPGLPDC